MPSIQSVERFVSLVESGQGLEAIQQCYAEHASMQENGAPPREGKAALLAFEHAAQASVSRLMSTCVRPVLIEGDVVVIRWLFSYTTAGGKAVRFEELAYQQWEGDLIVRERFFYDPAQLG
ncbi:MAG TPA: nuclear transport factor 2 family protein [Hydrogenophaga sp.]